MSEHAGQLRAQFGQQSADNRLRIQQIVDWCAASMVLKDVDKGAVMEQTKEYLKDTTNSVGEQLLGLSDSIVTMLDQHMSTLDNAKHRVDAISTVR